MEKRTLKSLVFNFRDGESDRFFSATTGGDAPSARRQKGRKLVQSVSQNWEPYIQNIAIERDSSSGFEEVGISEIFYASFLPARKSIMLLVN